MTDKEIICEFMEPRPDASWATGTQTRPSLLEWWHSDYRPDEYYWKPWVLTLDDIWEVEESLTQEQRHDYLRRLALGSLRANVREYWLASHATLDQKIQAIAAILRPIVEIAHKSST